ncbi:uncharacterized protein [Linepithema humile]|uniref:uncharacterized protein isoform X1 n=1 Tax=Linepithema humile TaxID=83485 RepID=UPI00351E0D25
MMEDEESVAHQTVDSETIKSEMPDGVENSSLWTAIEDTQGDGSAESVIDEGCELDEEKNERYQTAVFTLATFAAVFVLYVYVVYNLSSPPTLFHI